MHRADHSSREVLPTVARIVCDQEISCEEEAIALATRKKNNMYVCVYIYNTNSTKSK
jgi:hypothetical protein